MRGKILLLVLATLLPLYAAPVPVRYPQGLLRGFLVLRSQDGAVIASGELHQFAKGAQITNQLTFRFKDGSFHQETAVFSQRRVFRLVSYHLVQKGPSFKRPTELRLNGSTGQAVIRYTEEDGDIETIDKRIKVPNDLANGLVTTLLTNIDPKTPKTTLSMMVSTPEPRMVKLEISPAGTDTFYHGQVAHKSTRYVVKIEIGGITGIIAPLVGKQPPDTHVWIVGGQAPGFLKSEGPICEGCPIWRIELASPVWKP